MAANNGETSQLPPLQDPDRAHILGRIRIILDKIYNGWKDYFYQFESVQGRDSTETTTDQRKGVIRLHQVWPGKNVFFFNGNLILGPDPKGFLITAFGLILSNWAFCVYIAHNLSKNSSLIVSFSMILTTIVLVNLIVASTSDPGIIPRQDQPPAEVGTGIDAIRSKWITVNGIEVKLKHCKICKHFRPPRSYHCAVCDNCVERFDHHCPWISQCIGLRNYRYYLLFISSGLVLFIYFFFFSCERMKMRMSITGAGLFATAVNTPEAAALALFSMAAIVFLGGLTLYHAYLVMLNQTAYENYKQRKDNPNPYNKGILSNIKEALFTNNPTSRVNFQAEVVLPGWSLKSTMATDGVPAGKMHVSTV